MWPHRRLAWCLGVWASMWTTAQLEQLASTDRSPTKKHGADDWPAEQSQPQPPSTDDPPRPQLGGPLLDGGSETTTVASADETADAVAMLGYYALASPTEPQLLDHYSWAQISMLRFYRDGAEPGLAEHYGTRAPETFFGRVLSSLGSMLTPAKSHPPPSDPRAQAEQMAQLEAVLKRAVSLRLTNEKAVGITRENVESGRQTAAQYIAIWEKRVGEAESYDERPELDTQWVPDGCSQVCMQCAVGFWLLRRRHHCRGCGWLLCDDCSSHRQPLKTVVTESFGSQPGEEGKTYRVCSECRDVGVDMKRSMDIFAKGGKISHEQAMRIWEIYDADGSGTLSREELRHVLVDCLREQRASLVRAAGEARHEADEEVRRLLRAPSFSPELGGSLQNMAAFASKMAAGLVTQVSYEIDRQLADPAPLVEETFARMDADGNGNISRAEFVNVIGEILAPPGLEGVAAFDIDVDGGAQAPSGGACLMM